MSQDTTIDSHLRRRTTETGSNQDLAIPEEESSLKPSQFWLSWDIERTEWDVLLVSTTLKLLLYPA